VEQALANGRTWVTRFRGNSAAGFALAVFVLAAATIGGAWFFQLVLKLPPCELCLKERIPYYVILPLSLLLTGAGLAAAPRSVLAIGFAMIVATALAGVALGTYHAGVEWRLWSGPTDCTGTLGNLTAQGSLFSQLRSFHVVRCDEAAWRFLGISLAGYNALISLGIAALAACGLFARSESA
jgi:disulfide bond formation protein DsbB